MPKVGWTTLSRQEGMLVVAKPKTPNGDVGWQNPETQNYDIGQALFKA